MGEKGTADWLQALRNWDTSYLTGLTGTEIREKPQYALADLNAWKTEPVYADTPCDVLVIGEPVYLLSMKAMLQQEMGISDVRMLCPLADAPRWLLEQVEVASVEDVIRQECRKPAGSLPTRFTPGCCRMKKKNSFPCPMKPIRDGIITPICPSSSGRPFRHG
jgi:hypothetical protein